MKWTESSADKKSSLLQYNGPYRILSTSETLKDAQRSSLKPSYQQTFGNPKIYGSSPSKIDQKRTAE